MFSLVKTLLSRNFCKESMRVNFHNFHTVSTDVKPTIHYLYNIFKKWVSWKNGIRYQLNHWTFVKQNLFFDIQNQIFNKSRTTSAKILKIGKICKKVYFRHFQWRKSGNQYLSLFIHITQYDNFEKFSLHIPILLEIDLHFALSKIMNWRNFAYEKYSKFSVEITEIFL